MMQYIGTKLGVDGPVEINDLIKQEDEDTLM
jgi:hypothetical protein